MGFALQKIEQAIRHVLGRIDAPNAATRRKIYETTWNAHEKSIAVVLPQSKAQKAKKREQLTLLIRTIEAEYRSPRKKNNDQLDMVSPKMERASNLASGSGPEEENTRLVADSDNGINEYPKHEHKRSWLGAHALFPILLAIMILVVWFFYNSLTGTGQPTDDRHTSIAPMRRNEDSRDGWIQVFDPGNVTSLAVRGAATAEVYNEEDTSFVRIHGNNNQDAAIIEIGQGVLMKLRGKTVTLNIIARSANKKNKAQLSLTCDFGNGMVTGRRRFEVLPTRTSLLFNVDIPQSINGPAKLYINSDLLGKKHEVDIFSVLINTGS